MLFSPLINQLVEALRCLPGIGSKSAQRIAFHLLERDRASALKLADRLQQSVHLIKHCESCNILSETKICVICSNQKREQTLLCIVESPGDVVAIEQSGSYQGRYFVLMGHLSPLEGIGPEDIGIPKLCQRLEEHLIEEIILATNPTIEGEATANYIAELAKQQRIKISRIAHGVPLGGELEFIDSITLRHAILDRKIIY